MNAPASQPVPKMTPLYRLARLVAQTAFVTMFRGRVFGRDNVPRTGGVLLASNHQSFFDPISTTCALPREGNYMARDTLFTNKWFGGLIHALNAFPVKRGTGDVGAVKEILRRLRDGRLVVVFPEGTRTHDGSLGRINPNSMGIAKKVRAAVVPVYVDGAFVAWPRSQLLPSPRPIHVTYAKAITPEEVAAWTSEEIARVVTERLRESAEISAKRLPRASPLAWLDKP